MTKESTGDVIQEDIISTIEALIFASGDPVSIEKLGSYIELDSAKLEKIMGDLLDEWKKSSHGFKLYEVSDSCYQFRTDPDFSDKVEKLFSSRPRPLSRAAQETLAIIAYRQPATRVDIEFIRGVDAGSIIKNLLEKDLIKCAGRKEDLGRPMLFATTDEFLRVYGLQKISDLPPLESFQPSQDLVKSAFDKISSINSSELEEEVKNIQKVLSD
jgi:segregation and condensation protein B